MGTLTTWTTRQWLAAAVVSVLVALAVGVPTDVIPNPVFGRPVAVTWWSYPVLAVASILAGLLVATYLTDPVDTVAELDTPSRFGGAGGLMSFFAVGCPVCNKLVVAALGTTGALEWFAPAQPLLALGSIALLAVALRARLRTSDACPMAI